eukprot:gene7912-9290_t
MSATPTTTEEWRLLGNKLFGERRYQEAIVAYNKGGDDHTLTSNKSACYYELGQYDKAIETSQEVIKALDSVEDPKLLAKKNRLRIAKALYLCGDQEKLKHYLTWAKIFEADADIDSMQNRADAIEGDWRDGTVAEVPRLSPARNCGIFEYYTIGHDHAMSALLAWWSEPTQIRPEPKDGICVRMQEKITDRIMFKQHNHLSFFFGGVGDARHVILTLADANRQIDTAVPKEMSLHLTLNDIHASPLSRDLIIFSLLEEMGRARTLDVVYKDHAVGNLATLLYYIYIGVVMPPAIYDILMARIDLLLAQGDAGNLPSWLLIDKDTWRGIRETLVFWRREPILSTKHMMKNHALDSTPVDVEMRNELAIKYSNGAVDLPSPQDLLAGGIPLERHADFYAQMKDSDSGLARHARMVQQAVLPLQWEVDWVDSLKFLLPPLPSVTNAVTDNKKVQDTYRELYKRQAFMPKGHRVDYSNTVEKTWRPNVTMIDQRWSPISSENIKFNPIGVIAEFYDFKWVGVPSMGEPKAFDYFINVFFKSAHGLAKLVAKKQVIMEIICGDMHAALGTIRANETSRSAKGLPTSFDSIYVSNVPDYTGFLSSFVDITPMLKFERHSSLSFGILLNTGLFKNLEEVVKSYTMIPSMKDTERYLGVKHVRGDIWDTIHWTRCPSPVALNRLLTREALSAWLVQLFILIAMPAPIDPRNPCTINAPNNVSVFFRLLAHLKLVGYPSHWLQEVVDHLCANASVTSTSFQTNRVVPVVSSKTPEPKKYALYAFHLEFKTQASLWLQQMRMRINTLLPSSQTIKQWTVGPFTCIDFGTYQRAPSIMAVIERPSITDSLKMERYTFPIINPQYRKRLIDPANYTKGTEDVHILSVVKFDPESNLLTFFMSEPDMTRLRGLNCTISIFRKDVWTVITRGLSLPKTPNNK